MRTSLLRQWPIGMPTPRETTAYISLIASAQGNGSDHEDQDDGNARRARSDLAFSEARAGLTANDRLKYYFSLLQVARDHADQPDQSSPSLRPERAPSCGSCGGTIDKFIGDAVMWRSGAHRRRGKIMPCAAAARRLPAARRSRPPASRTTRGHPLQIRIGINSGRMLVGNIGSELRLNYTVIGDARGPWRAGSRAPTNSSER